MIVKKQLFALLVLLLVLSQPVAGLAAMPEDPVSDDPITWDMLMDGEQPEQLTSNQHFAPSPDAEDASVPFIGTLALEDAVMATSPEFEAGKGELYERDTTVFPGIDIEFITVDSHLVPVNQDVIAHGTLEGTTSYWDVIVQPGRVWQMPGGADQGWNRAAFPFSLVQRLEGETHTGLALFLYNEDEVSPVRFQKVVQTAPFEVVDFFNAWGVTEASYQPDGIDDPQAHADRYVRHRENQLPTAPLDALEDMVSAERLAAFDGVKDEDQKASILQTALVYNGVLYKSPLETAAGPFPYSQEARHGVWSVTKSGIMNVAMLRLAEKYGTELLDEPIADYVSVPDDLEGWENVTFLDMANMASGRGATEEDPTCYLCDYYRWYLAHSKAEKIDEALDYPSIWEPGTKYVYRDQDAFLLSVALEKFLQSREGDDAALDQMLLEEVFEPIGIYYLPANFTIEAEGEDGHIRGDFGWYPTLDDLAKVSLLYQNYGAWNGEQILERQLVESLLPGQEPPEMALVKEGEENEYGSEYYAMNWHIEPYRTEDDSLLYLPSMTGWGGHLVTLLPGEMVALRIANAGTPMYGSVPQARLAEELQPFSEQ